MNRILTHIDCGESIPFHNPHAVSVSLPTIADVIGYEEGDERVINKMQSGYPRFFRNKLVQQLVDYVRIQNNIPENILVLPISSQKAYSILCELVNEKLNFIELFDCVFVLINSEDSLLKTINDYIRNTGLIVSSRQAEKALFDLGQISQIYEEDTFEYSFANQMIYKVLSQAYKINAENIILTNSGANAIFSACEAIIQKEISEGKNTVVQLGWLYLDTMEVVEKRSLNNYWQVDVYDLQTLDLWLTENHKSVSLLVTEVVSNPKLDCLDVEKIYAICKKYNIKLLLDVTLITPFNFNALEYCDVAVESLSKFACGNADVLMGTIVSKDLKLLEQIKKYVIEPFSGEIERLGCEILGYQERVENVSVTTQVLIDFFSNKPQVKKVLSVKNGQAYENYKKITSSNRIPGLISVVFNDDLSNYYDFLAVAKGPSLGTEFTLAMPYMFLAHYDLLQTEEGRNYLKNNGLESELLRISVGLEPIERIVAAFEKVFLAETSAN